MDTPLDAGHMTTPATIPIYTIGYGTRSVEQLLAILSARQIAYVIDIRSSPYSRYKPEFNKDALEREIRAHQIRYTSMGDTLGGRPNDPDCYSDDKVDYDKIRQKGFYHQGIARLQQAFTQQLRVVLLCSEGKPENCHRSKLIGETLTELGIPVMHIDENDQLVDQDAVIARLTAGQLSLFDSHGFTSRKRYMPPADEEEENA